MTKINLTADKRELVGRKVKNLRREGLIPANVYGKKTDSFAIQMKDADFFKAYEQAGETGLIDLNVGKSSYPVLVSGVQKHPVDDQILHVDLRQVDLKEKIMANVPVEIIGEAPAEKSGLGTLVQQIDELEVEALPTDFPENFQVDISGLSEVDQAIYIKDLSYDKAKLTIQQSEDDIVVKIEPPQEEKVEEPVTSEAEEPAEGGATEAPTEGESPAEGEQTPADNQ